MKKIPYLLVVAFILVLNTVSYAEFYSSLPEDIGSNSNIMKVLYPENKKVTSYSQNYLISCMAEPGTEITLYQRYEDNIFTPILVNNRAVTGTVGSSGLYLLDMNFRANSTNRIMFFAQKGKRYQSIFRTITIGNKAEETKSIEYKALNIHDFVMSIKN